MKTDELTKAREIALKVKENGGTAYFVGGFVRDRLLGRESKDIDIEVHSVDVPTLRDILSSVGQTLEIGESFGIFSLRGTDIDIALPRKERATGRGHRDFEVSVDPYIGTKRAAARRDFTVNALMQNVLTGEITDHYGGLSDLKNGILRHVSDESFPEDPLRALRLAQLAARFGFSVAEETVEICRTMELNTLSPERIRGELKKALLKADKPSVFFEVLRQTDGLDFWFPEVKALEGIPQNPVYHPEGDVWNHTMEVLDRAAVYRDGASDPFSFMLSALVHDFGKVTATREINGVLHAYSHEIEGLVPAEIFLRRITKEKSVISYCLNMLQLHMKPVAMLNTGASQKSFNRMFDESVSPSELLYLAFSDSGGLPEELKQELLLRLARFREIMSRPYVQGADLVKAGLEPDKSFSEILSYAHKLRLAGTEKENALKQTLSYAKRLRKNSSQ